MCNIGQHHISHANHWLHFSEIIFPTDAKMSNVVKLTHWGRHKWPPFSRRHFQMHFLEWICMDFDYIFTEICSEGFNYQYHSIGSAIGLAPARRQANIWTYDEEICWRIYASLGLNELIVSCYNQACVNGTSNPSGLHLPIHTRSLQLWLQTPPEPGWIPWAWPMLPQLRGTHTNKIHISQVCFHMKGN